MYQYIVKQSDDYNLLGGSSFASNIKLKNLYQSNQLMFSDVQGNMLFNLPINLTYISFKPKMSLDNKLLELSDKSKAEILN